MSQKELVEGFLEFENVVRASRIGAMPQVHIPQTEKDDHSTKVEELPPKKED